MTTYAAGKNPSERFYGMDAQELREELFVTQNRLCILELGFDAVQAETVLVRADRERLLAGLREINSRSEMSHDAFVSVRHLLSHRHWTGDPAPSVDAVAEIGKVSRSERVYNLIVERKCRRLAAALRAIQVADSLFDAAKIAAEALVDKTEETGR